MNPPRGLPRWFEATTAALALAAISPLLLPLAVAVAASSRGSVLYRQERVGRRGRQFVLYKLRTMRVGGDGPQITARDDSRITPVGRYLRKMKLDELPELWNVLKGDMSLVGPRPEVPRYLGSDDLWTEVLAARPGLTDPVTLVLRNEEDLLARVGGEVDIFYRTVLQPYKLLYYSKYLRERTAWTDIVVLCKTIYSVVFPHANPAPTREDIVAWAGKRQTAIGSGSTTTTSSC